MSRTITVHLERPTTSAEILDNYSADAELSGKSCLGSAAGAEQVRLMQDLESQKTELSQLLQVLGGLVDKLNQFYDKVFAEHREEIARLSVEIARKVLMQKVQEGDYEIESIVQEALKNAPTHQDAVVHLNPEDLVQCQRLQQDDSTGSLAGIKFISDPNIGRAECLLETGKGIVESLIDQHLERIGKAFKKAE